MTLKFPRTYADLRKASYIADIEVSDDGVFLYLEEKFLPDATDYTAWGEHNLKEALHMLKIDYWKQIKLNCKH
tara:strand:- start:1519 stop:1737 length:219 start_codon:yes stop_codon:yes gene_type:complete